MFIEDVTQWETLEPIDADYAAMSFVAGEVMKYMELHEDSPDEYPIPTTINDLSITLGEELAFQKKYDAEDYWHIRDDIAFEEMAGRVDAYLPYFLENYAPAAGLVDWQ